MNLFIVSEDNQNILDNILKEQLLKKYVGNYNLKKFLTNSIQSMGYFDTIIIDLQAISGNNNDIVDTIKTFRNFSKAKIVFFIDKTEKSLISELIEIDVYNIITAEAYNDIIKEANMCFSIKGMDVDYLRKQVGLESIQKIVMTKLDLSEKELSIAFVGSMDRVGVTNIAINFCTFLSDECCAKTLYVEVNKSGHLKEIAHEHGVDNHQGYYTVSDKMSMITYGVDTEKEKLFNVTVFDLGTMNEKLNSYLSDMDIVILVSGCRSYELIHTQKAKDILGDISFFNIVNFASGKAKLGIGYMDNIFMDKSNFEVYEKIIEN